MRKRNTLKETWNNPSMDDEMLMLFGQNQRNLSEVPDGEVTVRAAAVVASEDIDTETTSELLVIITHEGECLATISPTFVDNFFSIANYLASKNFFIDSIQLSRDTSKRGREFLICGMGKYHPMTVEG